MRTHRFIMVLAVVAMTMTTMAPAALASDQSTKEAAGWGCGGGLPPGHCISPGTVKNFESIAARGGTFQLLVYDAEGNFLTAEIATFRTSADGRPCPHDDDARNVDGTYWGFVEGVLYVCHHQPG